MALFSGNTGPLRDTPDQYNRTNTKLQAGTHDSPGEKFAIDPRLKRLFRYHFGGDGWVVIPKGRAVAAATDNFNERQDGVIKDFDSGTLLPVLTLANGGKDVTDVHKTDGSTYTRAANKAIGVAYGNLYEEFVDGFNGMQPTIENTIYIELPYIPVKADAEEIHWGSFYDANPSRPAKNGDFVMSDENGRLIVADFDQIREQIKAATTLDELKALMEQESIMRDQTIGQIWSVETNMPPQGWLKWVGWSQEDQRSDDKHINNSGFRPEDIGAQDGFPGYPYEKTYANWDKGQYKPQGIPGLTNGSNIEVPYEDEVIGTIQPGQKGRHDFRLEHLPAVAGTVEVKFDGQVIEPDYVNAELGLVVVTVDNTAGATPKNVTATYKATGQIPGIPTGWDFKGSIGAVRILLHK
ncbi:hypothetical protein PUW25_25380 (plasmid) [Paenibacillus urinalis]|uniref:Uncharacterized protein n=1 Tax=Paenibacillus urinalis TaxID=521520 RepID=A0ABY7XHQ9_9BACL|nr:hypothetical protein [Paenibacillus urinalis]WDI05143.1 hypothetical protein PUW25_25380 [Paenibacillus urinalis]